MIAGKKIYIILIKNVNFCLLLLLVCFILLGLISEKIPINNGLGWDGAALSGIITDFEQTGKLSTKSYFVQRMLPFMLVWIASKLFLFSLFPVTIVTSFLILNATLLLISFHYWARIASFFRLGYKIRILTFTGIFMNYAILKMTFYYPVLTDTMAFTLGIASFYYYLKEEQFKLLVTILLGAFTFPTFIYVGVILFLWPYRVKTPLHNKPELFNWAAIFAVPLVYGVFTFISFNFRTDFLWTTAAPINLGLLPISIGATLLYLFMVAKTLQSVSFISLLQDHISFLRILFIALCFLLLKGSTWLLADLPDDFGAKKFGLNVFIQSLTNPLNFLLCHTLYFGPVFLLLFLNFKTFKKTIISQGIGTFSFAFLYLLLFIGTESRQFINALPVFMVLLGLSLKGRKLSWQLLFGLMLLSLGFSRFWFQVNKEEFTGNILDFPWQNYFMGQGPWMSHQMYFIFLAIIIIISGLFYLIFRKDLEMLFNPNLKRRRLQFL